MDYKLAGVIGLITAVFLYVLEIAIITFVIYICSGVLVFSPHWLYAIAWAVCWIMAIISAIPVATLIGAIFEAMALIVGPGYLAYEFANKLAKPTGIRDSGGGGEFMIFLSQVIGVLILIAGVIAIFITLVLNAPK